MAKLTDLKKGDIFKFGDKPWDAEHRFHSLHKKEGERYNIWFMGISYAGDIEKARTTSFTWRDDDEDVWIPKYLLSEQRRTKGTPCLPVSNHRIFYPMNLNKINLSEVYCSHDKYWYQYESINL